LTIKLHRLVGEKTIKEICDKRGLTPEDKKVVEEVIKKWEELGLIREVYEKISVAMDIIKDHPRRSKIISAVIEINGVFMGRPEV